MSPIPLFLVSEKNLASALAAEPWLVTVNFRATPHSFCLLPDTSGTLKKVIVGVAKNIDMWAIAGLPRQLPAGDYTLEGDFSEEDATLLALGWELGRYQFTRYKEKSEELPRLHLPPQANAPLLHALKTATFLSRDLINTPANHMQPAHLAAAAQTLAASHHAHCTIIDAPAILEKEWGLVWAVGKGSDNKPCIIDIQWGNKEYPKVTLVGKGVCFDSGGLDIKPASAMKLMKKDMGGAAIALGLAHAIMAMKLPVRLRVLIPAAENSISGNAFRPMDVIKSRKGTTVEIGDTDAEGRLILADCLDEAARENPALLINFATLTGAARVALGAEMPAFFTNTDTLATDIARHSVKTNDPLWQLPLYAPYRTQLNSTIADINNISSSSYGGAITAALFLKEFVPDTVPWVHIDCMAWNVSSQAGRLEGGEAMGLRAIYSLLAEKYHGVNK